MLHRSCGVSLLVLLQLALPAAGLLGQLRRVVEAPLGQLTPGTHGSQGHRHLRSHDNYE